MSDHAIAWALANRFHAGQKYGNEDYTYHLKAVQCSVGAVYFDERLQDVAILHDILEDTDCPASVLTALFEDNVVDAIHALTKGREEPRSDYIAKVKANPLALIVKRHDALCNLTESLKRGDQKRVRKYSQLLIDLAE